VQHADRRRPGEPGRRGAHPEDSDDGDRPDAAEVEPGHRAHRGGRVEHPGAGVRANVEHNHALQRRVIIMNTQVRNIPYVAREYRLIVDDVRYEAEGITQLHASFGFQDEPNVPAVLRQAVANGFLAEADLQELTYFLSRIAIVGSPNASMPAWQTRLFLTIAHNAANPAEYFGLPVERPIGIGAQIPL